MRKEREHQHPANVARYDQRDRGQRAADAVASAIGSWRFIIIQTAAIAGWITVNCLAVAYRWDPYPFILLNLAFSTQAAYAAPILQLSSNRSVAHDRARAEADFQTDQETLAELRRLRAELAVFYVELSARAGGGGG